MNRSKTNSQNQRFLKLTKKLKIFGTYYIKLTWKNFKMRNKKLKSKRKKKLISDEKRVFLRSSISTLANIPWLAKNQPLSRSSTWTLSWTSGSTWSSAKTLRSSSPNLKLQRSLKRWQLIASSLLLLSSKILWVDFSKRLEMRKLWDFKKGSERWRSWFR